MARKQKSNPKLKTHKGAKKRFTFTASGQPMMANGPKSHFRRRKAKRVLRSLDRMQPVDETMVKNVERLLPYGN